MFRKVYRWERLDRIFAQEYKLRHLEIVVIKKLCVLWKKVAFIGEVEGALDTSAC